jgi:hypothetical protein
MAETARLFEQGLIPQHVAWRMHGEKVLKYDVRKAEGRCPYPLAIQIDQQVAAGRNPRRPPRSGRVEQQITLDNASPLMQTRRHKTLYVSKGIRSNDEQ